MTLPSLNLLLQSILSGIFIGSLYGLIGLGLGLTWGLLRQINLAHFGLLFLAAYLSYHLATVWKIDPLIGLLLLPPLFFVIGAGMQWLLSKFAITPFNSLLVTFGITVVLESLIQGVWTADFRKLESHYADMKFTVGGLYVPVPELITLVLAVSLSLALWAVSATPTWARRCAPWPRTAPSPPLSASTSERCRWCWPAWWARWPRRPASAWRSPSPSRPRRSSPGWAWCSRP
jgi:branched-subunit amino acid ABC-type transport system permease component